MATVGNVQLTGFDKLERKFLSLPKKVQGQIARPALRNAAKIVAAKTVETAPVLTGQTKRAVKVRAGKRSRLGPSVNVQIGSGSYKGETFYAAFVEFGHKVGKRPAGLRRKNNPTQDTRKEVPGVHFMEKAFEATKELAAEMIVQQVAAGIVREASK